MYRKTRDSALAAGGADKAKGKPKPKVALKRTGSSSSNSSNSSTATTETGAATNGARKRPTKLRAPRERRARDRSMDDDEDLEHKFSNLSVAAPAFVPGKPFVSTVASPGAGAGSKASVPLLNGRSLAFVTERSSSSTAPTSRGPPPPLQWAQPTTGESSLRSLVTSDAPDRPNAIGRPNVERRPRRQRIGAMGFSKTPGAVQGRVTRQSNGNAANGASSAGPRSLSLKPRLTDDASAAAGAPVSGASSGSASAFTQRPRSDSAGSDSDYGSDDEVYPEDQTSSAPSAFPDRLTLFSQQKHIPKKYVAWRDESVCVTWCGLL